MLSVTGLGNYQRPARMGVKAVAKDWGQSVDVASGITVTLERTHHVSARLYKDRSATLWTGFLVTLPGGDLYFAGDTGPGDMHWADAAATDHHIRLALLPIGALQANGSVSPNHIDPAHAVTAFQQLGAAYALGIHWGTFELTNEAIDMPRDRLRRLKRRRTSCRAGFGPWRPVASGTCRKSANSLGRFRLVQSRARIALKIRPAK